jgi:hypothetical protein
MHDVVCDHATPSGSARCASCNLVDSVARQQTTNPLHRSPFFHLKSTRFEVFSLQRLAAHLTAFSMATSNYATAGTQTDLTGPVQPIVRPDIRFSAPKDTSTPPEEAVSEKSRFASSVPFTMHPPQNLSSTLLAKRHNRPTHIAMPPAEFNEQAPFSPPPTHALLSPLPKANRRDAGHTPLIPRSLSPASETQEEELVKEQPAEQLAAPEDDGVATPDEDQGLSGALTLPANPVDGAEEHFGLDELDHVLSKIAKQQATLRGEFDDEVKKPQTVAEPQSYDDGMPLSRKASADSRKSEFVDGVTLKTPPSNFGAPMGQL